MNDEQPINVQVRVAGRNGWISIFTGESRGQALERILPSLNARGYRVAFVIEDKFSFLRGCSILFWRLLHSDSTGNRQN